MKSKWFHLKQEALSSRKKGKSIREIEKEMGIARSTLSGWMQNIQLTSIQHDLLKKRKLESLVTARQKAVLWHNGQKTLRLQQAASEAEESLAKINLSTEVVELAASLLYLGEGGKKTSGTKLGNSDPLILKFFWEILRVMYKIDINSVRVYLHLRADQDPEQMKKYWSEELRIPLNRFGRISIDKRTAKTKTFSDYKGVCMISCGNIAIQRKLIYISRKFCEKTIELLRG